MPSLPNNVYAGQAPDMFRLPPELKAKGEKAEADFRAWLNRSGVAYMYVEQSPLTVPEGLRGRIKRPDYLVGLPHAGIFAFDVKAKTVYDGHLIFDREEIEKQFRFARQFNVTCYLACLDLEREGHHWWVPLADLMMQEPQWRARRRVVEVKVAHAFSVNMAELSFLGAVMQYSFTALERA